jgi:hypothetical protein
MKDEGEVCRHYDLTGFCFGLMGWVWEALVLFFYSLIFATSDSVSSLNFTHLFFFLVSLGYSSCSRVWDSWLLFYGI